MSLHDRTRRLFRAAAPLVFVAISVACVVVQGRVATAADDAPRAVLAPTGKLRVGLYPGTPTSILQPDAQFREPRGVGYELGRQMAARLQVPYEPVVFAKNAEVLEAVKTAQVDMVFTNATAVRAKDMDFGPPYLEIELGYLVPRDSPIRALPEIDMPGRRVGVTTGSTSDSALSRDVKTATIVRAATIGASAEMMSAGEIDAFATNKAALFELAEKLPGSRVLDGRWGVERHAIAIPKGRESGVDFVKSFTADMISSGFIDGAIARAGLRGAVTAAIK